MRTILLLIVSNIFMTFAWYGHLKFRSEALWKVILASWGIAFFEYCFQVPANRIGSYEFNGAQLKTAQDDSRSHHALGFLHFLNHVSGRKIPMELRRGLRVHRARRFLRLSQVVRTHSGDSGEALWSSTVRDFLQDRVHPPRQRFLDKVIL